MELKNPGSHGLHSWPPSTAEKVPRGLRRADGGQEPVCRSGSPRSALHPKCLTRITTRYNSVGSSPAAAGGAAFFLSDAARGTGGTVCSTLARCKVAWRERREGRLIIPGRCGIGCQALLVLQPVGPPHMQPHQLLALRLYGQRHQLTWRAERALGAVAAVCLTIRARLAPAQPHLATGR